MPSDTDPRHAEEAPPSHPTTDDTGTRTLYLLRRRPAPLARPDRL